MPRYTYTAKSFSGDTKSGVLDVENEKILATMLRQEGYVLVKSELETKKSSKNGKGFDLLGNFKKVPLVEKIFFARNLQIMIGAGISLPRALRTLSDQTKNAKFKKAIFKIEEDVVKGQSLSDALSRHPQVFSELFVSMIKVGEESGTLEDVLKNLTHQMEREHDLRSKVKGAMMYPAVIVCLMLCIGILMMIVVIPKLAAVFKELNVELPVTTRFLINSGQMLINNWPFLILTIAILFFFSRLVKKSKRIKKFIDKLILRFPIFGNITKKINTANTARVLGSLIISGVPIIRALDIVANTLGNFYFNEAIKKVAEEVQKGKKLAQSLEPYQNLYPSIMVQMIAIGEETGETGSILSKIADFYEEEVSNITKNLSSIIEPLLMVVVGIAVGFFAISMIQPMYSMMGSV